MWFYLKKAVDDLWPLQFTYYGDFFLAPPLILIGICYGTTSVRVPALNIPSSPKNIFIIFPCLYTVISYCNFYRVYCVFFAFNSTAYQLSKSVTFDFLGCVFIIRYVLILLSERELKYLLKLTLKLFKGERTISFIILYTEQNIFSDHLIFLSVLEFERVTRTS